MLPFRSEIRNSPSHPTIKIFLSDEALVPRIKKHLDHFDDVELVEIRKTYGRNREGDNLTIFLKDHADITKMKSSIDSSLWWYFEEDLVD
ncbi:hypothetical protein F6U93_06380 [Tamlana haliotis]|uniref:Uncharacterized protein n=1 Tax=Pseudotamlana haliotis TaxID=2614804 RepID=A0A6N6MCG4_9FLAO|nr:hypothetical protein [Tamlana haliotis]KAB1068323.1 hypothetical protein F6U93_06380 [Tamlana haliotis]